MQIKVIPVGPIQTNCYFLIDETTQVAAMIDPGDDWEVLRDLVGKLGVELQYILLTHGHYDHTTAVPELQNIMAEYFGPESYHLQDYSLYYGNLQKNIADRIAAFERK